MGGPALKPTMHRTKRPRGPRSSTNPPGVGASMSTPSRAAASSAYHCCATSVYTGTRPSGGSMTSDVCLVTRASSVQNRLYVPGSPSLAALLSCRVRWSTTCWSRSATSSSVNSALSLSSGGRSRGVFEEKSQTPCKSGSPQLVFSGGRAFVELSRWAASESGFSRATPTAAAKIAPTIWPPRILSLQ